VCRGAWLPKKYIDSVRYSRVFDPDEFDKALVPNAIESHLLCPQACGPLRHVQGDAHAVAFCPTCSGAWFPSGALAAVLRCYERRDNGVGTAIAVETGMNGIFALLGLLS
jgi:Zn-finger nucleic acid-binding protein